MSFYDIVHSIKRHWRLLIALPVAFGLAMGVYAYLFMDDTYSSTASMYVLVSPTSSAANTNSSSSLQSDLNSSEMITTDVADLLNSSRVRKQVLNELGLDNLNAFSLDVEVNDGSRVINLTVTGKDAEQVAEVANSLAENVSETAQEVMGIEAVNIVDEAEVSGSPSGPQRTFYIVVSVALGLMIAAGILVVIDALNTRIRSEEALEEITGLPIMGRIPLLKDGGVLDA